MSRNILPRSPTTDLKLRTLGTSSLNALLGLGTIDRGGPALPPASGVQPEAPSPSVKPGSFVLPFFKSGRSAVTAIGLALVVGFGSLGSAHAQAPGESATSSCARDAAYSAQLGAQIGRMIGGDDNAARAGGVLAALLHRVGCNNDTTVTPQVSAELQRTNAELEEALRQDSAKFTGTAELSDGLKQVLGYLADQVRAQPNKKLVIVAHANEAGSAAFVNRGLANERARAVATFLADKGIGSARVEISGASEGDGLNRVQIVIVEARAQASTQESSGGLFGIPGLEIQIGGDRNRNRGPVLGPNGRTNGTVTPGNGGQRTTPGPGSSGWNGR
jgi:outer membrane protein OmpA-like peptidoglycan-associated protein